MNNNNNTTNMNTNAVKVVRNIPEFVHELVIEQLLNDERLHQYIIGQIKLVWADQLGKMSSAQKDEFICQQQLLWYKDVLIQSALRL